MTRKRTLPSDTRRQERQGRRGRAIAGMAARRLAFAVPVLLVVTFVLFALGAAAPFDPVRQYLGAGAFTASGERITALRENFGLDQPFTLRWLRWLGGVFTGELGYSRVLRQPVADVIAARVGWTLLLVVVGMALLLPFALLTGTLAARRPGGWLDRIVSAGAYLLTGAPVFWVALLAVWLFAVRWEALPAGGLTAPGQDIVTVGALARHIILPAAVLAVSQTPWFILYVRQAVTHALAEDFVTGARARGLPERVVLTGHALRSALLPFLTLAGARVPELITGVVLVETVFSWPGVAQVTIEAARAVDFPLLAALTALATVAVIAGNLLADVLYALADPRAATDG